MKKIKLYEEFLQAKLNLAVIKALHEGVKMIQIESINESKYPELKRLLDKAEKDGKSLLIAEFVPEIEALVEITGKLEKEEEKGNDFYNNLSFDYRITDLNSIQKEKQISNSTRFRSIYNKVTKVMGIITILIGILFLTFEIVPELNFMDKQVVNYAIKKDSSELVSIIASKHSDEITLSIEGENEKRKISVEEFNNSYKIEGIKKTSLDPKSSLFNRVIGIVYIIMGILLLYLKRKKKKAANTVYN